MSASEDFSFVEHAGTSVDLKSHTGSQVVDEDPGEGTEAPVEDLRDGELRPKKSEAPRPASGVMTGVATPTKSHWFEVLRRATEELSGQGATMTAAAVSLRMRAIDGGFAPRVAGYTTFGGFLRDAADAGVVNVHYPAETGKVDTMLTTVDDESRPEPVVHGHVPTDLWRAFTDWGPNTIFVWEPKQRSVRRVSHGAPSSAGEIPVPSVGASTTVAWMRQFIAEHLPGDLQTDHDEVNVRPSELLRVIRASTSTARKWNDTLRVHVLLRIQSWLSANHLKWEDLKPQTLPVTPAEPSRGPVSAESHFGHNSAVEVRSRVVEAVGKMSLADLLRLPIPIEYLLL